VQANDGIHHQLARAVIRDISPALHTLDRDARSLQSFRAGQDVGWIGPSPKGNGGCMLHEDHHLRRGTAAHTLDCGHLQLMDGFIGLQAKIQQAQGSRQKSGRVGGHGLAQNSARQSRLATQEVGT